MILGSSDQVSPRGFKQPVYRVTDGAKEYPLGTPYPTGNESRPGQECMMAELPFSQI